MPSVAFLEAKDKGRYFEEIGRVLKQVTKEVVAEYQDKEPDQ